MNTHASSITILLSVVVGLMLPRDGSAQHAETVNDGPELRIKTGDPAGEDGGEASSIRQRRFAIGLSAGYSTVSQNEWFDFWQGMLLNFPRQRTSSTIDSPMCLLDCIDSMYYETLNTK